MTKRHALPRVLTALALAAALPVAACGDDDDDDSAGSEPAKVAFELKGSGEKPTMEAPGSVEAGPVEITLTNSSKEDGGAQLLRVEGDHTVQQALAAGVAWGEKGKALPDWVKLDGGAPNTKPGATSTVTQTLEPGKYAVADINSNASAEFEVTGDGAEDESDAPTARIEAVDYSFNSSGLKAGKSEVVFENTGKQPHFVVGLPIKQGKTIDDVKTFLRTEKGEPPVDEEDKSVFDTAVFDGGNKQVINLNLKQGKYAFVCFIPDREGGQPHVAKGMIAEADVQ